MTILGLHVTSAASAFVWTDAELVRARTADSGGFTNKLAVNALAAMVCLGTGWSGLIATAIGEAMRAPSLDDAVRRLPPFLRRNAERLALQAGDDAAEYGNQLVALVGWSHDLNRIVGYQLSADACFQPVLQNRLCLPHVPAFDGFDPDRGASGLARVVQQQMVALRDWAPAIRGGTLTIAHVRPGQVSCGPHSDLVEGNDLCGAPSPVRPPPSSDKFASSRPAPPDASPILAA